MNVFFALAITRIDELPEARKMIDDACKATGKKIHKSKYFVFWEMIKAGLEVYARIYNGETFFSFKDGDIKSMITFNLNEGEVKFH